MITEQQFLLELADRIEALKDAADGIMHIKRGRFMRTRALIRDADITEDYTLTNLASWYRAFHKLEEVKQLLAVSPKEWRQSKTTSGMNGSTWRIGKRCKNSMTSAMPLATCKISSRAKFMPSPDNAASNRKLWNNFLMRKEVRMLSQVESAARSFCPAKFGRKTSALRGALQR